MTSGYFESPFEFDALCNNIAKIDDNIELVAVLNQKGRVVETAFKDKGIDMDLTPQKKEMLFMEYVLKSSMNKEYDDEFGKVQSSILMREKFTVFSFELLNYVILIISKPIVYPIQLKNNILEVIIGSRKVELVQ